MEQVDPETVDTPNSELGMRAFFRLSRQDVELAIIAHIQNLYPDFKQDCMMEVLCARDAVAVAWRKKPNG